MQPLTLHSVLNKRFLVFTKRVLIRTVVTRLVLLMISSARHTGPTSSDHYFHATIVLFCNILKSGDGRTDGNLCENNDHYQPGLWIGRVDQKHYFSIQIRSKTGLNYTKASSKTN